NIVLDYIFIYLFGWGMAGASFATILSPAITLAVLTIHLHYSKRRLHFESFNFDVERILNIISIGFSSFFNEISTAIVIVIFNFDVERILYIISIGFSSFFIEISTSIVIVIFNFAMLTMIGDIGVASYGIVANINLIAILIFQGMGQGVQPLISRYRGMDNTS